MIYYWQSLTYHEYCDEDQVGCLHLCLLTHTVNISAKQMGRVINITCISHTISFVTSASVEVVFRHLSWMRLLEQTLSRECWWS